MIANLEAFHKNSVAMIHDMENTSDKNTEKGSLPRMVVSGSP